MNLFIRYMIAALSLFSIFSSQGATVSRVSPAFWWSGLNNATLQVLIYGDNVAQCEPSLAGTDISIKETVRPGNPRYLLLYLNIEGAKPQKFDILLKKGHHTIKVPYELKARRAQGTYAQGFDAGDVIYLLMPDRFAQGNPHNAKAKGMLEKAADRNDADARHGGDLQGIIDHLDYFNKLGVTALWTTPVLENNQPGGSYHGYAITDYYNVDARLGGNEAFLKFVQAAHSHGLKVIMDMVFNHCGSENYLFKDMPAPDWFNYGNHYTPTNYETASPTDPHAAQGVRRRMVDGWFVESMPDFNQRNRHVADYLVQNSIWWIEYAGIDGIRQDTYPYCDFDMMANWCSTLTAQYPKLNIVGETWIGSNPMVACWQKDNKLSARNPQLPTVMDFPLWNALQLRGEHGLQGVYADLMEDIVYPNPLNLLTFMENHDTDRFFHNAKEALNIDRYKQALTLLLTLRGIPQLYYGGEILMHGNKLKGDGAMRSDFPGGWKGDPENAFTGEGLSRLQREAFNFTSRLLHWRQGKQAISRGSLTHYPAGSDVYVYSRHFGNERVTVMLNGSAEAKSVNLADYAEVLPAPRATNVLTGGSVELEKSLELPPYGIAILEF